MDIRINWFGVSWMITTGMAIGAAVLLIVLARKKVHPQKSDASRLFVVAAAVEMFVVIADPFTRLVLSDLMTGPESADRPYFLVLDFWTILRPALHAFAILMIVRGIGRVLDKPALTHDQRGA